jgi:hypothetical protein
MAALLRVLSLVLLLQAPLAVSAQDASVPAAEAQTPPAIPGDPAPPEAPTATAPATSTSVAPTVEVQPPAPPGPTTLDAPGRPVSPSGELALTRATVAELLRLEDDMDALDARRRKRRLGGPLALMIAGSAVGAVFGIVTLAQASTVRDIESDIENGSYDDLTDVDADNDVDWNDHAQALRAKRVLLGVSLVGLNVGIGGAVWFFSNLRARRPLDASRAQLRTKRDAVKLQLKLQLSGNDVAANFVTPF